MVAYRVHVAFSAPSLVDRRHAQGVAAGRLERQSRTVGAEGAVQLRAQSPSRTPQELEPLSSYVLVRPTRVVEATSGGVILPTALSKNAPIEGEVIAVGPGEWDEERGERAAVWAQVGQKVLYAKFDQQDLKVDGQEFSAVRDRDILLAFVEDTVRVPPGKVLVRLSEQKRELEGGILLSDSVAKKNPSVGSVVAVGEEDPQDSTGLPLELEEGDVVRFRSGDVVTLDVGGEDHVVIPTDACVAKWKP